MSEMNEEESEFRGGTLQLSTDNNTPENSERNQNNPDNSDKTKPKTNANPSVLSGADSLSSSSSSFADCKPGEQAKVAVYAIATAIPEETGAGASSGIDPDHPVYPRYDVPFDRENIKDFFTFRPGVVEEAIQDCITGLLFPEDGEYLGAWLLTEITLWDNEKERIVILTSRLVLTIKYDFIAMKQLDFKKTYLEDLDSIVIGRLVYPPSSLVPRLNVIASGVTTVLKDCVIDRMCRRVKEDYDAGKIPADTKERALRGVRLIWNKGQPVPMKTIWNPFSREVPLITYASHPVFWHKDGELEDKETYDVEIYAKKLQRAIEAMPGATCSIHRSPIVIKSYVGLTSFVHNKTNLGFFKVRGKFSF